MCHANLLSLTLSSHVEERESGHARLRNGCAPAGTP